MSYNKIRNAVKKIFKQFKKELWFLKNLPQVYKGYHHQWDFLHNLKETEYSNPFLDYTPKRGIKKWEHYYDIYHRHFNKFRGKEVHVVEVGVHSGGSLELLKHYFGSKCHIYGIDILEECKRFEDEQTTVIIGDQGERTFWEYFKTQVPRVDILIDDGSHKDTDQIMTLQQMLSYIQPGGIYLCEDIRDLGSNLPFYIQGMTTNLNTHNFDIKEKHKRVVTLVNTTNFQQEINSIHHYPFLTVIEKNEVKAQQFKVLKQGKFADFYATAHLRKRLKKRRKK